MLSGNIDIPLWVHEGSHRGVCVVHQNPVKKLRRVGVVGLVKVPPYSAVVVNGDLYHAGPTWTDASKSFTCVADTIRYHVHSVKAEYSFSDGIPYLWDSKPKLLEPSSTNQADLDAVLDTVCDESLAVEVASTETSTAPRGPNKPDLKSSGHLPQQADRSSRSKQRARSSRKK